MTGSGQRSPADGAWRPDPTGRYKVRWQLSIGEWTQWAYTADGKMISDPVELPKTAPTSGASASAGWRAPTDQRHEEQVSSQAREPRMPEFLTTSGVSYHLEEIIKRAETFILLISPYLKTNGRISPDRSRVLALRGFAFAEKPLRCGMMRVSRHVSDPLEGASPRWMVAVLVM